MLDKLRDDPDRERKEKVLRNALGVFYSGEPDSLDVVLLLLTIPYQRVAILCVVFQFMGLTS